MSIKSSSIPSSVFIRGVLIDLSGTIVHGNVAIPGACAALERLVASPGIEEVRFVTNTSTKSTTALVHHLVDGLGFPKTLVNSSTLVTSVLATKKWLQTNHYSRPLCLLDDASDFQDLHNKDSPKQEEEADDENDYDCVVVGLAPTKFHYSQLNIAYRVLTKSIASSDNTTPTPRSRPPLIAIHRANYIRDSTDGKFSLGPGAFVTGLEAAADCTALVIGKPSSTFFQSALSTLSTHTQINAVECCMIGDDIRGDIHGAQKAGIGMTLLVQTGKYQIGDEQLMEDDETGPPTKTCPSIVEAIDFIMQHNHQVSCQES